MSEDLPIARCRLRLGTTSDGIPYWWWTAVCPFCQKAHSHAGGYFREDPLRHLGSRRPHCDDPRPPTDYQLVQSDPEADEALISKTRSTPVADVRAQLAQKGAKKLSLPAEVTRFLREDRIRPVRGKKPRHSPGPWRIPRLDQLGRIEVVDANGTLVAVVHLQSDPAAPKGHPTEEVNARLISAAPELLAACKAALMHTTDPSLEDQLESAIHKVTLGMAD